VPNACSSKRLPEEEIETFLPQICNMILDRESLNDPAIFDYFEKILISKCAQCLPFGCRSIILENKAVSDGGKLSPRSMTVSLLQR
jgi:hypothetical protein